MNFKIELLLVIRHNYFVMREILPSAHADMNPQKQRVARPRDYSKPTQQLHRLIQ
jgi:hypothetical protein